jgi:hypothetical protein
MPGVGRGVIAIVISCSIACLLAGCTLRLADLTAVSTRNVNLDGVDLDKLPGTKVTGTSSGFTFLVFPLSSPCLQVAVDDALGKGHGDLITDAVIYQSGWWFLVGQQTLTVKGTVVNTRGTPTTEGK